MTGVDWAGVVAILGALVLVGAAAGNRMPRGTAWRYGLIWGAVFVILFVGTALLYR